MYPINIHKPYRIHQFTVCELKFNLAKYGSLPRTRWFSALMVF